MKTINNKKHLLKSLTPRVRISIGASFGCPCQARTDDTRINSVVREPAQNRYTPLFIRDSAF